MSRCDNNLAFAGNISELDLNEVHIVSGGGFFETLGDIYDNPGRYIGKAIDKAVAHGRSIAGPKGYWANGVYNIK